MLRDWTPVSAASDTKGRDVGRCARVVTVSGAIRAPTPDLSMPSRNWLPLLLLLAVSAVGAALPERQASRPGGPINPVDVAWMLTATGLVLLMTPGLSFF